MQYVKINKRVKMKFFKIKGTKQEIKISRKKINIKDRQRRYKNGWIKGVPKEEN